jgi:glycosyltransferase involved in cell wall biosynthesis
VTGTLPSPSPDDEVVVVIPCHNEAPAIAGVVAEVRLQLPAARIVVVDNASSDDTAAAARAAGADVLFEPQKGKARAVLTAFERISARWVVLLDGDGSYPVEGARAALELARAGELDMVTGVRRAISAAAAFRPMHQLGSRAFERVFKVFFDLHPRDLFSGLRIFSRRYYETIPLLANGFELELEFTIQAIDKGMRTAEVDVPFRERTAGTSSKLSTVVDGLKILRMMIALVRDYRPLFFFGWGTALFVSLGLLAGAAPVYEYFTLGMIYRFPLAILAASLMVIGCFTLQAGIILESNLRHHRESHQLRLRSLRYNALGPRETQQRPSSRPQSMRLF